MRLRKWDALEREPGGEVDSWVVGGRRERSLAWGNGWMVVAFPGVGNTARAHGMCGGAWYDLVPVGVPRPAKNGPGPPLHWIALCPSPVLISLGNSTVVKKFSGVASSSFLS